MWIVSKCVSGRWRNNLLLNHSKNRKVGYSERKAWYNSDQYYLLNRYYKTIIKRRGLLKRWILNSKISQKKTKIKDNSYFYLENNKDLGKRKKKWKDNILEQELIRYNNKENFELPFFNWGRSPKSDLWDVLTYLDQTVFVINIEDATVEDTIPFAIMLRNLIFLINSWANWLKKTAFFELKVRKCSFFIF